MDYSFNVRRNMYILHSAINILVRITNGDKVFDNDEKGNKSKVETLFGKGIIELLESSEKRNRDNFYNAYICDRSSVSKFFRGNDRSFPKKMGVYLKKRGLLDDNQLWKFEQGELYIVLNKSEKSKELDDLLKMSFE